MHGEQQRRWQEFCELAAHERNPERLIQLVSEMNRLFENEKIEKRRQPDRETNQVPTPDRSSSRQSRRQSS